MLYSGKAALWIPHRRVHTVGVSVACNYFVITSNFAYAKWNLTKSAMLPPAPIIVLFHKTIIYAVVIELCSSFFANPFGIWMLASTMKREKQRKEHHTGALSFICFFSIAQHWCDMPVTKDNWAVLLDNREYLKTDTMDAVQIEWSAVRRILQILHPQYFVKVHSTCTTA